MVKVHLSQIKFMTLKMQEWQVISMQYIKVLQKDSYNDQKRKQAATKQSAAKNEESHALKTTLGPKTPKISIKKQKC